MDKESYRALLLVQKLMEKPKNCAYQDSSKPDIMELRRSFALVEPLELLGSQPSIEKPLNMVNESLGIQIALEKPKDVTYQDSLKPDIMELRRWFAQVEPLESGDTQDLMEKPQNMDIGCSSLSPKDSSSGNTKQIVVVAQPPLFVSVAEAESQQQSRRYPTRRRVSVGESHYIGGQDVESTSEAGSESSPSPNAEAAGSSKRKLHSRENADSLCTDEVAVKDGLHSWLQDDEFKELFTSIDEQSNESATSEKVRGTLRLYRMIYARLPQEEPKLKESGQRGRLDLMALKLLKSNVQILSTARKYLGSVPGIEIGDEFHLRTELSIIGLHRNLQAGIEYIKHEGRIVAASIVSSGCYGDIMDTSDVLLYSGSGGYGGDADQKLEGGNLALKNSIDAQTPVRVIYGFKEEGPTGNQTTKGKKVARYVYDGLYLVEKYWSETGSKGYSTLMFRLRRKLGQPQLDIKEFMMSKGSKIRRGLCIEDISQGKEKKSICVVNTINNELPMPFTYITRMVYPSWYRPTPPRGCDCIGGCSDSVKCACVVKNGGEIPFNCKGDIIEARPLVYECGPSCRCPPSCQNRASQHGIKFDFEIFKTKSRGWGVRSLTYIPSGSFICEYTGEMLEEVEAEKRENDEYLFDIGKNYNDESLWEGLPNCIPNLQKCTPCDDVDEEGGFTVDAAKFGNVARFINHSCTPNLYAQNLLYDHDDQSMPHIMLFASENISPFEELTYHYNYSIDRVRTPAGTIKRKDCYCGSFECTGRLY